MVAMGIHFERAAAVVRAGANGRGAGTGSFEDEQPADASAAGSSMNWSKR